MGAVYGVAGGTLLETCGRLGFSGPHIGCSLEIAAWQGDPYGVPWGRFPFTVPGLLRLDDRHRA